MEDPNRCARSGVFRLKLRERGHASRLERQGDNQGDTALIRWCNRHIRDPVWRSSGEVLKPLPDVHTDKFDYYPVLTQTNLPD